MSFIQLCDKSKHDFLNEDGSLNVFQPNIEVIAFALCNVNRFTGHVGQYSVAQHSIYVYEQAKIAHPSDYKLQLSALLHDAPEAYLNDMSSPLKKLIPKYREIEAHHHNVIDDFFKINTQDDRIKEFDLRVLATEADRFGLDIVSEELSATGIYPYLMIMQEMKPKDTYIYFMSIFNFLEQAQ
tara:strand:+ start:2318 stop:2866 length:549 start_codon:yes stop_codon:yes gene_type:complete